MVGRERNSSVSRKERVMWGLLTGLAIIGVVAIGLVAGGFLRTIPSMMTAARVRRVLDGTTSVQDFPITLADGTTTSLYAECASADDVIVSFVSTACGQCLEEMHTLSAGVPHKTGMRVAYLPITSEPQSMLNEYRSVTIIAHQDIGLMYTYLACQFLGSGFRGKQCGFAITTDPVQ